MWKKLAVAVLAVTAAAAFIASRPSTYRIDGAVEIAAAPALVLAQLAEVQRWAAARRGAGDPHLVVRAGGPPAGVGSSVYWSGAESGRMTVVGLAVGAVTLELETLEPRPHEADVEIRVSPAGAGARVAWTATGPLELAGRIFGLLPAPARAIAARLDGGLAGVKDAAEAAARIGAFRVERAATLPAAPSAVLAQLSDLRRWGAWSPWVGDDAAATFGGPPSGTGASRYWAPAGDRAGGRVTITRSGADGVEVELDVAGPQQGATSDLAFRVAPAGDSTRLTIVWAGEGDGGADGDGAGPVRAQILHDGLTRLEAVLAGGASP